MAPQAPALPPVMLEHVTLTAEVGTVAQLVKEAADACIFNVHVLPEAPPEVIQLTVADELAATDPRSGSVAVKLMVPGLADTAVTVVAMGRIGFA